MNIEYYTKTVYGIDKMYVKDEKTAQAISSLTNQKTLTEQAKTALESLGFKFNEVIR